MDIQNFNLQRYSGAWWGARVVVASDGQESIREASKHPTSKHTQTTQGPPNTVREQKELLGTKTKHPGTNKKHPRTTEHHPGTTNNHAGTKRNTKSRDKNTPWCTDEKKLRDENKPCRDK